MTLLEDLPTSREAAHGALLGLAVGDVLGTTLELTSPSTPRLPVLATCPHREVTGGGPFGLQPGQVTDDTQMATCLARSMIAEGGFEAEAVGRSYVVRLAFWHVWHTESFEAALVDVVNRGGDSDTNGAIAGALIGARVGVRRDTAAVARGGARRIGGPVGPLRGHLSPQAADGAGDVTPG